VISEAPEGKSAAARGGSSYVYGGGGRRRYALTLRKVAPQKSPPRPRITPRSCLGRPRGRPSISRASQANDEK
jgi:hypothetical protein